MFFAMALPIAMIATAFAPHGFALAWTDIFSNIWNSIWSAISAMFHLSAPNASQQFASRLSQLQTNESELTQFYLSNVAKYAKQYNVTANVSWSVQVTDVNSSTSPIVGQLTITWNNTAKGLYVYDGIVNSTFATYAVNMTHSTFLALSRDAVGQSISGAIADFGIAEATHGISYRHVG